jgi:hypothetical protein
MVKIRSSDSRIGGWYQARPHWDPLEWVTCDQKSGYTSKELARYKLSVSLCIGLRLYKQHAWPASWDLDHCAGDPASDRD